MLRLPAEILRHVRNAVPLAQAANPGIPQRDCAFYWWRQRRRRVADGPRYEHQSKICILHKLREAMGSMIDDGTELQGEVEIDGAYFGKGPKQANRKADRIDRRAGIVRQVVAVARERLGRTMAWVVGKESDSVPMIRQKVASGSTVHADE